MVVRLNKKFNLIGRIYQNKKCFMFIIKIERAEWRQDLKHAISSSLLKLRFL